ncbi:MAG: helix-hairpin-helix domain-containing protein [Dehalococcoidia bacterium]|nr:helix-hairpin-helix domain-containing protein [Dehalococcoidia bacterium]
MTHEVSQVELARTIGLTTRQIRNLELEGMPHRADGARKYYPVPGALDWYIRRKEEAARAEFDFGDFERARARHEAARARLAEIQVAKEEGQLIPVEVVESVYGERMLDVLRSGILNMPGRWGAQIVGLDSPRQGEAALKRIGAELLEAFSGAAAAEIEADDTPIPDDFPGVRALRAAGLETMTDLLEVEELRAIPGIGPATESRIRRALDGDAA